MSTEGPATINDLPSGPIDWSPAQKIALGAAVGGFALYGIVGAVNLGTDKEFGATSFITAALAGWVFWISFPIGATALLMVHYLVKTSWGLLLKRFFEACTRTFPLMALLFIPVVAGAFMLGERSPYWWVAPEHKIAEVILDLS